jgi:hypothetical protein
MWAEEQVVEAVVERPNSTALQLLMSTWRHGLGVAEVSRHVQNRQASRLAPSVGGQVACFSDLLIVSRGVPSLRGPFGALHPVSVPSSNFGTYFLSEYKGILTWMASHLGQWECGGLAASYILPAKHVSVRTATTGEGRPSCLHIAARRFRLEASVFSRWTDSGVMEEGRRLGIDGGAKEKRSASFRLTIRAMSSPQRRGFLALSGSLKPGYCFD